MPMSSCTPCWVDDPSLAPLKQLLIVRTVGNPFFLERACAPWWRRKCWWASPQSIVWGRPDPPCRSPAQCRECWRPASIGCRPRTKRLLQTAAVIGTEGPVPLLQPIAERPEDPLQHSLTACSPTEFLYETRSFPSANTLQACPHT